MKKCSRCKEIKDITNFNKNRFNKDGLHYYCKFCQNICNKLWRDKNKESRKDYFKKHYNAEKSRKYYINNKEKISKRNRINKLKNKYSLTQEEYRNIIEDQKTKCAICGKKFNTTVDKICIDHDHNTGKIRGLLCHKCNVGLGMFEDNFKLLIKALNYLKERNK